MTYDIETRTVPEQTTAVIRDTVPADDLPGWLMTAYAEVNDHIRAAGERPTGPPFARFAFHDAQVSVEAGVPVSGPVQALGRVTPSHLGGGAVAATVHQGPYGEVVKAYDALQGWVLANGYEKDGWHYEVYLVGPWNEPDPAHWLTEIVVPYRES